MTTTKNKSVDKDFRKKQRRNKWTIILFLLYLIFGSIFIFFGHKISSGLWVPSLLISCFSPLIAAALWFKWKQKTKWQDFVSTFKMIIIGGPFVLVILFSKDKYRDFHLQTYRKLTNGLVVGTGSQYYSRGATTSYFSFVQFTIDNTLWEGKCYMYPDEYKKGDSVLIAYSYKDPHFYELAGLKH